MPPPFAFWLRKVLDLCARAEASLGDRRVVALLVVVLAVHCAIIVPRRMGDFRLYHRAAERLVAGEPVHRVADPHRYLYAPVVTFFFVPFALLPVIPASVVWYALQVWLVVSSLKLAERLVYGGERGPPGFRLLVLLLGLRFVDNNLGHGQINLLLFWLILAAYDAAGRGRNVRAGFALAAAIVTKLFPLVLLLQLALARRWRFLGATLVAMGVLLVGPVLWWGDAYPDVVGHWIDVLRYQVGHYDTANKINQSIAAFAHRLFRPYSEGAPVVELSSEWVSRVTLAIHAAFLVVLVARSLLRRRSNESPQGDDAADLALYLLYATVASHYSWKYYFVDLLLPFAVVLRRTIEGRQAGGAAVLATAFALNVLPGLRLFGKWAALAFQLASFHFLSVVVLFAAIVPTSRRREITVSTP